MTEMQYELLVTLGPALKVDTGMSKAGSAREGGARAGGLPCTNVVRAECERPLGDAVGCVFGRCRGLDGRSAVGRLFRAREDHETL